VAVFGESLTPAPVAPEFQTITWKKGRERGRREKERGKEKGREREKLIKCSLIESYKQLKMKICITNISVYC